MGQFRWPLTPRALEVTDEEAHRHYRGHLTDYRLADTGTKVLFAVRGSHPEAFELLQELKAAPDSSEHWLSPEPVPSTGLPQEVRAALADLEEGAMTRVISTPIGFYVARLVERNPFDHFLVNVAVFGSIEAARGAFNRIKSGAPFEGFLDHPEQGPLSVTDLPEAVGVRTAYLDLGEVSDPIETPLGVLLVRLEKRWSEAPFEKATLVRVLSARQGTELLTPACGPKKSLRDSYRASRPRGTCLRRCARWHARSERASTVSRCRPIWATSWYA